MARPPGQPGRIVNWFRNFLIGRNMVEDHWLRFPTTVSTRSPVPPNIPGGPAHKLAANYYCSRDLRRAVQPASVVGSRRQLAEASETATSEEVAFPQITTPVTPGVGHKWTWRQSP